MVGGRSVYVGWCGAKLRAARVGPVALFFLNEAATTEIYTE